MKQVNLLIAVLAVVFSLTSAFTSYSKFTLASYSFIAGSAHPENASAWTYTTTAHFCPHITGHPCAIIANQGIGAKPDQNDVTTLASASSNMTIKTTVGSLRVFVEL